MGLCILWRRCMARARGARVAWRDAREGDEVRRLDATVALAAALRDLAVVWRELRVATKGTA
jgi:hypothetical protein